MTRNRTYILLRHTHTHTHRRRPPGDFPWRAFNTPRWRRRFPSSVRNANQYHRYVWFSDVMPSAECVRNTFRLASLSTNTNIPFYVQMTPPRPQTISESVIYYTELPHNSNRKQQRTPGTYVVIKTHKCTQYLTHIKILNIWSTIFFCDKRFKIQFLACTFTTKTNWLNSVWGSNCCSYTTLLHPV